MLGSDPSETAVPEGYRIGWKFCWTPTLHHGKTIWLRSIPVLQRKQTEHSCGMAWESWVTVAILEDTPTPKPEPITDF